MPGIVTYRAGDTLVHCIKDGGKTFDPEVFPSVGPEMLDRRLAAAGLRGIDTEFIVYLLRHADGSIDLVDAGCGALFGPSGGELPDRLADLNVVPDDVTRLIFTHLHGDHCGGAVREGAPVFGKAGVVLHRDELTYWTGRDAPAAEVLNAYDGRIQTVGDGAALGHGMTSWALPGHTPGHMGLRFDAGLVLVADILHSAALQLPDPDVCPVYDVDPDAARASRHAALAEIADEGLVWSGSHLIGADKFLTLRRDGAGYRAAPLA